MMISGIGRNKGFTLVEVIISVGILSFGLILVLQGFVQSLSAIRVSQNNLRASLLAEEAMSRFLIEFQDAEYGFWSNVSGETEENNTKYSWGISIEQDQGHEELNKITSTVLWESGRRTGEVSIFTYLRSPVDEEE